MAAKKTKKARKKKTNLEGGDTPITIGGGGGGTPKIPVPVTITYDPRDWASSTPPGTLTLAGGRVKKVTISTGDFELRLPVNGDIEIDLKVGKP
jgi:hypothetical protein